MEERQPCRCPIGLAGSEPLDQFQSPVPLARVNQQRCVKANALRVPRGQRKRLFSERKRFRKHLAGRVVLGEEVPGPEEIRVQSDGLAEMLLRLRMPAGRIEAHSHEAPYRKLQRVAPNGDFALLHRFPPAACCQIIKIPEGEMTVRGSGTVSRRQSELTRGLFPVEVIGGGEKTQERVRFRERRVQFESFLRQGANHRRGLAQGCHADGCPAKKIVGVAGLGQGELWIKCDGPLVEHLGLVHRLPRYLPVEMLCLQESFPRREVGSVARLRGSLWRKLELELLRDGRRNLVLHGKYIGQLAVVALRPEMGAVGGMNELCGYPDAVPGAAHAAFKDSLDAQRFGNPADVLVFAPE